MKIHFVLAGTALLLSSLAGSAEESIFPIPRGDQKPVLEVAPHLSEIVQEDGLIMRTYRVPPTYGCDRGEPFEDGNKVIDVKDILTKVGVDFSAPDSSALYSRASSILKVTLPEIEHRLVASYIRSSATGVKKQVAVRAEVFELPSLVALDLIEQCDEMADHTTQRNKIVELVENDKASLSGFYAAIAKSGNRSASQYGAHVEGGKVDFGLEIDPVLGADNFTIDVNFSLSLDGRKLISQVTAHAGKYYLIGSWSGDSKDKLQMVFVTSSVQDYKR